ncbi:MAG: hypothetical protein P4L56_02080 [Candidatus Sulfopaludibacter sp.]|nr:hypothetical protein [Candidatus Sulfopaludibacter sp.]
MRRTFLVQMIAGGVAMVCGGQAVRGQAGTAEIAGTWYLLGINDDERRIPQHRMDLRFWSESGVQRGAIVSRRNDGTEFALVRVESDGHTLRFQMTAGDGKSQAEMPTMTMTRNGDRWDGYWVSPAGAKVGYPLKLVPAAK